MTDKFETNRRPLKSRGSAWSNILTARLVAVGATPNQVSLASIGFAAFGALMLCAAGYTESSGLRAGAYLLAIVGIQGRLLCNLLDGMLAVESGLRSKVGEVYNDLPDRVSDILLLYAAGISLDDAQTIGLPGGALGSCAAIVAVLTAYIRLLGAACGTPHYFTGPMAKPHRMALLTGACFLSAVQISWGADFPLIALALWIIVAGGIATCVRRTRSILAFLGARRAA